MSDQEIVKCKKKYIYPKQQIQTYNQTFKTKHSTQILECPICFKKYSFLNKGYHARSKQHLLAIQILESLSNTRASPETDGSAQEVDNKGGV
jgi:hypothetical protein